MSDLIFPQLRGVAWGTTLTPQWKTTRSPKDSGRSVRIKRRRQPLTKLNIQYEFLRDGAAVPSDDGSVVYSDFETMLGFFNLHGGAFESFLFQGVNAREKAKYTVAGQLVGTSDGVQAHWQLVRNVGGFLEEIYCPIGTPKFYDNGEEIEDVYVVGEGNGKYTIGPLAEGHELTADFTFAYRCTFDEDEVEFANFCSDLYELQSVPLITVKP